MKTLKVVLSIAGSDSSGGAGIQADLKTMCAHGVYGMTAITAVTAQNTLGVHDVVPSTKVLLAGQLEACFSDIPTDAVKIGMLPNKELLWVVIEHLQKYQVKNVVLDPVMVSSSGRRLMDEDMVEVMAKKLFPLCSVITPNIPEAEKLLNTSIVSEEDMEEAAKTLGNTYGCAVLLKGGHFLETKCGDKDFFEAKDVLFDEGRITWFCEKRSNNPNTHGTGCTLSSAIASNLALGYDLPDAVERAKKYLTRAIEANLDLGKGDGPMNHMVSTQ